MFAEAIDGKKIEVISSMDAAQAVIEADDELLIRISKTARRQHIFTKLKEIILREVEFETGRKVRDLKQSTARYSPSNAITIHNLQLAFRIYLLTKQYEEQGEKVKNFELAKEVGLEVEQRNSDEAWDDAYHKRVLSVAVSRKRKTAQQAIENVARGIFP